MRLVEHTKVKMESFIYYYENSWEYEKHRQELPNDYKFMERIMLKKGFNVRYYKITTQ